MRPLIAIAALTILAPLASAQFGVGVGYGRYPYYYGPYAGPYLGYYPGAYGGFYSNGFSLYGPPVPTYGSIPGYFGGGDQRLSNFPDLRYRMVGPYGWRGYVAYDAPAMVATQRFVIERSTAVCEIHLPTVDATVKVNGATLEGNGTVRQITTPVKFGGTMVYELEAQWSDDRGIGAGRRSVILRPGECVVADFTKPE